MNQDDGVESTIPQKTITEIIREELLRNYLGKKNAKHRYRLLYYCHYFMPKLKDRRMRRIYSQLLPIHYTSDKEHPGIFVVDDPGEVQKAILTIGRTIETLEEKKRRFEDFEKFLIRRQLERASGQRRLFEEELRK